VGPHCAHRGFGSGAWAALRGGQRCSDAMEEKLDEVCALAGRLRVPAFMFQEGGDEAAKTAFQEIARLTKGAYCQFDQGSVKQLGELLRAVAVYVTGGMKALAASGNAGAVKLLQQLKSKGMNRHQTSSEASWRGQAVRRRDGVR
jgi:hypothetical protein